MWQQRSHAAGSLGILSMRFLHGILIVTTTALVGMLGLVVVTAKGGTLTAVIQLCAAVVLSALLLTRLSPLAAVTSLVASAAIAINQLLLSFGYLTFLNGGFIASSSAFGAVIG